MTEIRIQHVEALGKPLGPYSHLTRVVGPAETLLIVDRLVQEQFLVEVQTIAAR